MKHTCPEGKGENEKLILIPWEVEVEWNTPDRNENGDEEPGCLLDVKIVTVELSPQPHTENMENQPDDNSLVFQAGNEGNSNICCCG